MAGKLCIGEHANNIGAGHLSASKAYCEGMAFRASGTALEKPVQSNPHKTSSEDWRAWNFGWSKADSNAGGSISKADLGCCAAVPPVLA